MSDAKVKVIIKRPDEEYGHVTNISTRLKNLQKTVEGPIEVVNIGAGSVMLVNEEGKIKGLERNFVIGLNGAVFDYVVGTVIVIGSAGEEFCDLPMSFDAWKRLLREWGN